MARVSLKIIDVLRKTASAIEASAHYQWGHMGLCNCGFLAQEITRLRKDEIHGMAMLRYGDWSEQLNDYCPTSGLPMDDIISEMVMAGFDTEDLKHLERLSDPKVLANLPVENRHLQHNLKEDVIKYFRAWASVLERELLNTVTLPDINTLTTVQA